MSLLAGPGVVDVLCDCPFCGAHVVLRRRDGKKILPETWVTFADAKVVKLGWQSLGWDGRGPLHVCPACQEPPSCAGLAKLSHDYREAKHKHFERDSLARARKVLGPETWGLMKDMTLLPERNEVGEWKGTR